MLTQSDLHEMPDDLVDESLQGQKRISNENCLGSAIRYFAWMIGNAGALESHAQSGKSDRLQQMLSMRGGEQCSVVNYHHWKFGLPIIGPKRSSPSRRALAEVSPFA
jgi:hypothetical protein